MVTLCTTMFNVLESYAIPTHCIYVFCVGLRTNYSYFYCVVRTEYLNVIQYYLILWSCHTLLLCWVKAFSLNGFCDRVIQYGEDMFKKRQRTNVLLSQLIRNCERMERQRRQLIRCCGTQHKQNCKTIGGVVHFIWNTESRNSYKPKKGPSPFRLSFDKPINVHFILLLCQGENIWWQLGTNSSGSVVWVRSS